MSSLPYSEGIVKAQFQNRRVFVISDLHLAGGRNESGNYKGTENFFADESFARFLKYLHEADSRKSLLIINGDFIDFLRITDVPSSDRELTEWLVLISELSINNAPSTMEALRNSISNKEKKYGLKTNDFKSVWKLRTCVEGHQNVFDSLRQWVANGNELLIIKGNHDLEWYWPAVRNYFIKLMKCDKHQVLFADDKVVINDQLYIEHGHLYENITYASGSPTLQNNTELNLSFGAFFNRYLLNKIEIVYPYLDNIRPTTNILPVLIRERFPLALRFLIEYIPFTFKIIPKKQWFHALRYLLTLLFLVILPVVIMLLVSYQELKSMGVDFSQLGQRSDKLGLLSSQLKNLLLLALSYVFGRILVMVRLAPPGSLSSKAAKIVADNQAVKMVTFGHTHDPEQREISGAHYFNTGTWMPVFEVEAADVREDKTYTFLSLIIDENGKITAEPLLRWNDDSLRAEPLVLIDKAT
jgi:UDP-2,3-diacylglucosamine pyrophosphatase LpxH